MVEPEAPDTDHSDAHAHGTEMHSPLAVLEEADELLHLRHQIQLLTRPLDRLRHVQVDLKNSR
jgi:hypothetical protein